MQQLYPETQVLRMRGGFERMRQVEDLQRLLSGPVVMTLRDAFALRVLAQIMQYEGTDPDGYQDIATQAYQLADAMLKQRGA